MATTPAPMMTTAEQPKIILYWLEQSRSQRILWLLEELGLPYTLETFKRDPITKFAFPDSKLHKIHPLGKAPVISIQGPANPEPIVIAESANICEYLISHFGKDTALAPKQWRAGKEGSVAGETEEWLRYRHFMHYSEGSLMSVMTVALVVTLIRNAPVPFFIKPISRKISSEINNAFVIPNFKKHFSFLEQQLSTSPGGGQYLCGTKLSGADILLSFPLIAGRESGGVTCATKDQYPKLAAYIQRLEEEPGYKKAVEKVIQIEGEYIVTP